MSITYRRDYDELGLAESADWSATRGAYRRLVNVWHPDRYVTRPREREHAQQTFIKVTLSFDRLRAFYRENGRMPFEKVALRGPESLHEERVARERAGHRLRTASEAAIDAELSEGELRDGRGHGRASTPAPRRSNTSLLWIGVGTCVVVGTLVLFAVMDRNEALENYRDGREVLLETAPSEFMPSATEVRSQSRRGSFVTREDGELGDQLMEDIFRR